MKKIILSLLFLLIPLYALATPTFVQANHNEGGSGSFGVTLPSVTGGDLLVICVESINTILTPTDTAGNTYTAIKTQNNGTWNFNLYYAKNAIGIGSTNTILVSNTGSFTRVGAVEYSGILATTTAIGNQNSSTGTSMTTGSFSANSGDLVMGCFFNNSGGVSAGSGYTGRSTAQPSSSLYEDKISSGGSENPSGTGANDAWTGAGATFQASANTGNILGATINGATIN